MQYDQFLDIVVALLKLVVIAMLLERGLAFLFEHQWYVQNLTKEVEDPDDPTRKIRVSKYPGLKALLALIVAGVICFYYRFDVLSTVFARDSADGLGILVTSFVVAGGSAGAIAIFQGFLSLGKQARDALIAARKAEAEATKKIARQNALAAEARKKRAVAMTEITQERIAIAKAERQRVELERDAARQRSGRAQSRPRKKAARKKAGGQ